MLTFDVALYDFVIHIRCSYTCAHTRTCASIYLLLLLLLRLIVHIVISKVLENQQ